MTTFGLRVLPRVLTLLLVACSCELPSAFVFSPSPRHLPTTTALFYGLPDIRVMRSGDIRHELESYGIPSRCFIEKIELITALKKARKMGRQPVYYSTNPLDSSYPDPNSAFDASSTNVNPSATDVHVSVNFDPSQVGPTLGTVDTSPRNGFGAPPANGVGRNGYDLNNHANGYAKPRNGVRPNANNGVVQPNDGIIPPRPRNGAHQQSNGVHHKGSHPPANGLGQPPTNGAHQPHSNGANQPQTNGAHQPHTNGFNQPTNGFHQSTNGATQSPTNGAHQAHANGATQSPTNGFHQPTNGNTQSPTNEFQQPTNGFHQPTNGATQSPTNGFHQPTNGARQAHANGATQSPTNGFHQPTNGATQSPTNGFHQPTNGFHQPTNGATQSPTNGFHQPTNGAYQAHANGATQSPTNGFHQPTNGNTQSPTNGFQQPTNGARQAHANGATHNPTNGFHQATNGATQSPTNGFHQPTNGAHQPPTNGFHQPNRNGGQQPTNGFHQPTNGVVQPHANGATQSQTNGFHQPSRNGGQQPANGAHQPHANGATQPVNGLHQTPLNGEQQPEANEPTYEAQQPMDGNRQPKNGAHGPMNWFQKLTKGSDKNRGDNNRNGSEQPSNGARQLTNGATQKPTNGAQQQSANETQQTATDMQHQQTNGVHHSPLNGFPEPTGGFKPPANGPYAPQRRTGVHRAASESYQHWNGVAPPSNGHYVNGFDQPANGHHQAVNGVKQPKNVVSRRTSPLNPNVVVTSPDGPGSERNGRSSGTSWGGEKANHHQHPGTATNPVVGRNGSVIDEYTTHAVTPTHHTVVTPNNNGVGRNGASVQSHAHGKRATNRAVDEYTTHAVTPPRGTVVPPNNHVDSRNGIADRYDVAAKIDNNGKSSATSWGGEYSSKNAAGRRDTVVNPNVVVTNVERPGGSVNPNTAVPRGSKNGQKSATSWGGEGTGKTGRFDSVLNPNVVVTSVDEIGARNGHRPANGRSGPKHSSARAAGAPYPHDEFLNPITDTPPSRPKARPKAKVGGFYPRPNIRSDGHTVVTSNGSYSAPAGSDDFFSAMGNDSTGTWGHSTTGSNDVSNSNFVDVKASFVDATVTSPDSNDEVGKTSETAGSTPSSAQTNSSARESSSTPGSSPEEQLEQAKEKARGMKVSELKTALQEMGVPTKTFFEKSEFVVAYAKAVAEGRTRQAGSSGANQHHSGAPQDQTYQDVQMRKVNPLELRGGRPIIDV